MNNFNREQQLIRIAALDVAKLSLEELQMELMSHLINNLDEWDEFNSEPCISDEELADYSTVRTAQGKYLADAYRADYARKAAAAIAKADAYRAERVE
jgi:hypothetical protein